MKSQWFQFAAVVVASSAALAQSSAQRPNLPKLLDAWQAEHGTSWHLDVDEGTGRLEMLYGGRRAPLSQPTTDVQWFRLARQVLSETEAMHGIAASTLVEHRALFLPLGQFGTSDKQTVRFRQELNAVPVDGGFVNVLFDAAGGLLSIQERALPLDPEFPTRPTLTADTARELALAAFEGEFTGAPTTVREHGLVIAQVDTAEERVPVLAWKVDALREQDGQAVGNTYWIDARTGAVAQSESVIHHLDVGGTVYTKATPGNYPDSGTNPPTQQAMKYARITSAAGTITTDANGNFNYPGASGPLNITVTYDGTFNDVNNQGGANYSLVFAAATGSGNAIVLNNTPAALVTAQANCFQAVNELRDWIRGINPLDATMDFVATTNPNIASTCNAYFNGSSTNYYQAGGGCVNTAFANVIYHETGHWLNVLYGTGNGSDGMGEGNSDIFAMYLQDDPVVGHDFCGLGCNVRTGLNTQLYWGDAGTCSSGVHACGERWMGAAWKVRRNLKTSLGVSAGGALANAIFSGWMNGYNQTQIKSIILAQWLTLDDDDGSIDNGTPHFADINSGFVEQGFPSYTLPAFAIYNVTDLPDTTDQAGPYVVEATIAPNNASPINNAFLRYRVGSSGAFLATPMANVSGNLWSGSIPGQTAPAKVHYYVSATNAAAITRTYPSNAPTSTLGFNVGVTNVVFCDNFEANLGWTVTNTAVTSGAWERGNPIGTAAQPEDDNPAGTGTLCYFTDQGTAGGTIGEADVDGGPTVLTSPAFDLSVGNGEISYAYWYYTDDGNDPWRVEVSNNGSTWVLVTTTSTGSAGWNYGVIDVGSYVTPNATVRVRFSAQDNPNDSITEAAIDDVCVSTLGPVTCPAATVYCTAKVNSQGCTPAIATSGTASASSASSFDISVSQVINNKNGLLFYGFAQHNGVFQGGTLCVLPPLNRTPIQGSGGNAGPDDCSGALTFDFNARIQSLIDPNLVAGATVDAQYYYRDPADAQTVGLSNGVEFEICP